MLCRALLPLLGIGLVGRVAAIYEDQKGLNDWYQAYVGNVIKSCFSEEKRHFAVATESSVVGAIGLRGDVVWRHVYAPEDRLDDAACHGSAMVVASSGGSNLRAYDIHTGDLLWDKSMGQAGSGRAGLALSADGSVVAVAGGKTLFVMPSARPGDSVRRLEGMPQDVTSVQFNGEKVHVVGSTGGSTHAVVVDLKTMTQVGAATIGSTGTFARESFVYVADGTLFASDLAASPKVTDKSIESLLGSNSKDAHVVAVGVGAASGLVGVTSQDASALVAVKANGDISVVKKWKGPSAFGSTTAKGSVVVARVAVSTGVASEVLVLEDGSIVSSEAQDIALPAKSVHGAAVNVFPVAKVTDKASGKLGHRVLVTTSDHALILVAGSKHVFTREEGLASIAHARFMELPSDQTEVALLMEEFKSAGDGAENLLSNAIDRWSTQAVQFQRWITSLIQDGVRLFASSDANGEEKLTADTFGLRKVVVAVSKAGKAYGLFSSNGKIIWSTMLAGSRGAFVPTPNPIMLARSAAHYPHPPRAIVLGTNEAGQCVVYLLDPISGDATRQNTDYQLLQAMLLPGTDSTGASPVLLVDTNQNVHVVHVGENADEVIEKRMGTLHVFTVHEAEGRLQGYHIARVDGKLVAQTTWKVVFPTETDTIVTIAYKQPYEPIKLQFSVVDEKSTILYKYLNPNLLVVCTLSTDGLLSLYLVDTVTGGILHRASHTNAARPINAIQFENTVLYQFFDNDLKRYQVVVNDLFESGRHEDRIPFESSQAAAPVVARQAYVFQHPVTAMGVTITQQNIAYRQILMGLGNGALYALDRKFVDTRRPNKKESTLQDVPPYQPVLPYTPQQIINYDQMLHNMQSIVAAPTHLESHGLVFAYGLELFCTRVIPSGSFDLLNEDFNKPVLFVTVLGMMVASVVTGYLAKEKGLKLQWK